MNEQSRLRAPIRRGVALPWALGSYWKIDDFIRGKKSK